MNKVSSKKILLLTPVYPGNDVHKSTTPVVHYFTREWKKMGHEVLVVHYPVNFPKLVYTLARPFKDKISTIMGSEIRTWAVKECEYDWDNIHVKRIPLVKFRPHCRYSSKQIQKAVSKTVAYCESENYRPDVIISHWVNPSLEIMHHLKEYFKVPTCFVSHDIGWDLDTIYKKEAQAYLNETDVIGYRSDFIKRSFEEKYNCSDKAHFMCYSGLPVSYIEDVHRNLTEIRNFVFVGTLLKRKYPAEIIPAVVKALGKENFTINYIGYGEETKKVALYTKEYNVHGKVNLLGFMKRDEVVKQLDKNEVFVMISKNETFGLVYLEAMARGCITIASKEEGFDGIIKDGYNGFLCRAGDVDELADIILKIRNMTTDERNMISNNAVETAKELTDINVAKNYINHVLCV